MRDNNYTGQFIETVKGCGLPSLSASRITGAGTSISICNRFDLFFGPWLFSPQRMRIKHDLRYINLRPNTTDNLMVFFELEPYEKRFTLNDGISYLAFHFENKVILGRHDQNVSASETFATHSFEYEASLKLLWCLRTSHQRMFEMEYRY